MALLGTYTNAGQQSLANGANSISHGLPTQPDVALYIPKQAVSLPITLDSRGTSTVVFRNPNGAIDGELFVTYLHSKIR
ncbi:MAG TPA: hypothetical protein VEA38_11170 [Terriglobales bacterium]|nr:hypothetical protein [Terriglobales bacterium]